MASKNIAARRMTLSAKSGLPVKPDIYSKSIKVEAASVAASLAYQLQLFGRTCGEE